MVDPVRLKVWKMVQNIVLVSLASGIVYAGAFFLFGNLTIGEESVIDALLPYFIIGGTIACGALTWFRVKEVMFGKLLYTFLSVVLGVWFVAMATALPIGLLILTSL